MTLYTQGQVEERRRSFIVLMALVYSAITAVAGGLVVLALLNIFDGNTGYLVMLTVFGVVALLTGYWMQAYLRDFKAEPVVVEGEVVRKWIRGRLFELFFPACYISVEKKIFVISRYDYASLLETDLVRVRCYPHSLTVENIQRFDEVRKQFVATDGGEAS